MGKKRTPRIKPFSGFRGEWPVKPVTRVVPAKKGKGSYRRAKNKQSAWDGTGSVFLVRRAVRGSRCLNLAEGMGRAAKN